MVDPITVGAAIAAVLAKKAADKLADRTVDFGEGALGALVGRLRGLFKDRGDVDGVELLAKAQDPTGSPEDRDRLAALIDQYAPPPSELADELQALGHNVSQVAVQASTQNAQCTNIAQVANVTGSEININTKPSP